MKEQPTVVQLLEINSKFLTSFIYTGKETTLGCGGVWWKKMRKKTNSFIIYKQLRNVTLYSRLDFKTEIGRNMNVKKSKFAFIHCNTHLVHDK